MLRSSESFRVAEGITKTNHRENTEQDKDNLQRRLLSPSDAEIDNQRARQKEMYRRSDTYRERAGVDSAYLTHMAHAELMVEEAENTINFFVNRGLEQPFYLYDRQENNKDKIMSKLNNELESSRGSYDGCIAYLKFERNEKKKFIEKDRDLYSRAHKKWVKAYHRATRVESTSSRELTALERKVQTLAKQFEEKQKELEDCEQINAKVGTFIKDKAANSRYSQRAYEQARRREIEQARRQESQQTNN